MDHSSPMPSAPLADMTRLAPAARAPSASPQLSVVASRFRLAEPQEPASDTWREGLARLLAWLGIDAEFLPTSRPRRLPRMTDWRAPAMQAAPVFAPWIAWSPTAFQNGGSAGLPEAQYVASYLIDHPRSAAASTGPGRTDVMLMSPHPAICTADEAGEVPIPRAEVMRVMIRAARAERRDRIAIILHARQRNTVARQMLGLGKGLTREGLTLEIVTIEDALPLLASGAAPWDAVIAMPDLRSTIFTLLAHTSGIRRAWPMLWFANDNRLRLVTSEAPGEGASRLSIDAPALVHALALALREAGNGRAACRLHDAWARLRDSGVTTAGHGGDGPYVSIIDDSAFLDLMVRDSGVTRRPQRPWRALQNAEIANSGSQSPHLRVVSSSLANPSITKGR